MATKNSQIIFEKEIELAQQGKIPTMERKISVNFNGETLNINEPTHIYTAAQWRNRGYMIRKGEHAVAALYIWHNVNIRPDDNAEVDENGVVRASRMEKKKSWFFSIDQVEPLPERQAEEAGA